MNWGLEIGILAFAIALASIACSREPRQEPRAPEPPPEEEHHGYRAVEVLDPGSLSGVVRWEGAIPTLEPIPVRVHEEACGASQPAVALRVSSRGGVADAVVALAGVDEGAALAPEAATLATQRCQYAPHVLATVVGAPLVFRNADGVMHNVHAYRDGETVWDFALPELGATEQRIADEPGVLRVVCDIHAWMEGYVHVFDHPYFAVTDADGRFRISDVPPGQYVLRVWHEGWRVLGTRSGRPERSSAIVLSRTVSVSARQETSIDFTLSEEAARLAGE